MGYEVKVADIRNVRKATGKQIEAWLSKLQAAGEACNVMIEAPGIQGATAESIKSYINEIHLSLLVSVAQMMEEYKDRLYVYEVGYDSIDGAVKAHITQDSLEEQNSKLGREEEEFLEIANQLQGALDEISDILSVSAPSTGRVANSFERLKRKTRVLNENVGTYEEGHRNDCSGVKDQSSSIRAMIRSLSKNSQITIATYRAGSILENPEFLNLQNAYINSTGYYKGNGEDIKAAREYIDTREALAEARVEKGAWDVVAAVGVVAIGIAAVVVTGGAAAPFVAIAIGSTIAYGVSNGVEAVQDIQYGLAGDIESVASNPIRDTVFLGNQTAYDTWGTISTGISLGFCIPGASAGAGKVTIEGAKQGIQAFLGSGAKNIAKSTVSFGAKTLLIGGSGVAVEKVVTPYTSEDFGRLSGLLAGAYVGSKVMGVKSTETKSGIKTPDYVKLSEELGNKVESEGYKIIDIEDAVQANTDWADMGYNLPPVAENTKVYNVEAGNFEYARVFKEGVNNPKSPFVLRADDIKGLSASEIAEKYALPQVPDSVVYPHIPSDTPLEVSIVGPQESWGTIGGDAQYAIKDVLLDDDWFTDIYPLD